MQALKIITDKKDELTAILLDVYMPVMDGFEFLEIINRYHITQEIPVFMVTSDTHRNNMCRGYDLGVMDVINKPIDEFFVKRRVESVTELFRSRKILSGLVETKDYQIKEKEEEIYKLNYAIIETLSTAIEFRSGESGSHVKRIKEITKHLLVALRKKFPKKYNLSDDEIETIATAAIMHDVGKISISDAILNKPGKLTKEEFEIMKTHTTKGEEILALIPKYKDNNLYKYACDICRHHHERWDGKGYPDGLKGNEISIWAQVVSIADVFDALTTKRVYKDAYPIQTAVDMIYSGKCGRFNPELLNAFKSVLENMKNSKVD